MHLVVPSFLAGLLTFLAPCTLPMVPGYLAFISGVGASRRKILLNGLFYVAGFSSVFISLGSLVGLGGAILVQHRLGLARLGGIFVIFFGAHMVASLWSKGRFRLNFLATEHHLNVARYLRPGHPSSALLLGASFALGWSPCVGPVLGSVLTLAASAATVASGAFLLAVFSFGLAMPFLGIAWGYSHAERYITFLSPYLRWASLIGGLFFVFLGLLMLTNNFSAWLAFVYRKLNFINYGRLLDHL